VMLTRISFSGQTRKKAKIRPGRVGERSEEMGNDQHIPQDRYSPTYLFLIVQKHASASMILFLVSVEAEK